MGVSYRDRIVDSELDSRLGATGAVLIEGPRGCGKTETARRAARSEVRLDVDDEARSAAVVAPAVLLDGEKPRLIDEWQLVPAVWDHIRRDVDEHPDQAGRYILTGSAVAADDQVRHSGGLRFTRLRMRPMSLSETGHSSGDVSLSGLFAGEAPRAGDPGLTIHEVVERVSVGGWPGLLGRTTDQALMALRGFLDETSRVDLHRLDGVRRDPENVARVLRSLARNISTQASARAIAADVSGSEEAIDHHTVLSYVAALSRLFVIEDLPAWSPALRSRSALRQARTHHFVDPSLAVAALDADSTRLLRDIETLGLLFESLVVRDLRVYAQGLDANVYHYRDNTGLEADAIVQRRDGAWAAFEVKLGHQTIDAAAAALLRLAERVDVDRHGRPAALGVITGWGYAYRRPDGVDVIPIGTLAP
jgi:predicted AAA+ superfamily ATPase